MPFFERWISPSRGYPPRIPFRYVCRIALQSVFFAWVSYFPVCAVYLFIAGHPCRCRAYEVLEVLFEPGAGVRMFAFSAIIGLFAVFREFFHLHAGFLPVVFLVQKAPPPGFAPCTPGVEPDAFEDLNLSLPGDWSAVDRMRGRPSWRPLASAYHVFCHVVWGSLYVAPVLGIVQDDGVLAVPVADSRHDHAVVEHASHVVFGKSVLFAVF